MHCVPSTCTRDALGARARSHGAGSEVREPFTAGEEGVRGADTPPRRNPAEPPRRSKRNDLIGQTLGADKGRGEGARVIWQGGEAEVRPGAGLLQFFPVQQAAN